MPKTCPWCADPNAGDDVDPVALCRAHEAEFDGETMAGLDRRDAEQAAEYNEWVLGH